MNCDAGAVLCSTGAFIGRANGRDWRLIERYAPLLRCDGFEFMMYEDWYPVSDEMAARLSATDFRFPTMHVDKDVGNRLSRQAPGDDETALYEFERNCAVAARIGARLLTLHLWGNADSDRDIGHNLDMYDRLRTIADRWSLTLTVENVVCALSDPMSHMAALIRRRPDAAFTVDTKMSAFHRQTGLLHDPGWQYLWREGHIQHMHINDYGGGYRDFSALRTLFVGEGHVDFEGVFRAAARGGYRGAFTCECTALQPDGSVDIERLNQSLDAVSAFKTAVGL